MTRKEFLAAVALLIRAMHDEMAAGIAGLDVSNTGLSPFLFLRLAALAYDQAEPETQVGMRDWTVAQWKPLVQALVEDAKAHNVPVGSGVEVTVPSPTPPEEPAPAPAVVEQYPWLAPAEVDAYYAALDRAGQFARGLGNVVADDVERNAYETWAGEEMLTPADEAQREATLQIVREQVAEGVAMGRDAREVASRIGEETGRWSHDWKRVAETELQGVHNEGRVRDAIAAYGAEAQVARVTETGACEHCIRLFRDEEGNPRVFSVAELIANGTNVSRKKRDWRPTIWPVHPKCRCDTLPVPPGFRAVGNGTLKRIRPTEGL